MFKNEILKEQAKSLKFGNLVCKKLKITKKLQKKITKNYKSFNILKNVSL